MKFTLKIAVLALAAVPMFASAQTYLYIPSAQDHFDINGQGGGGPFNATIEYGPSMTPAFSETVYCDSLSQEFSLGQTFKVNVELMNAGAGSIMSLDPWVITQAANQAAAYDTANMVTLSTKEINSAIQGVIWELDGQVTGPITSGDANTGLFANFLYSQANTVGTYVGGYARYSVDGLPTGQSQIGAVPEPFSMTILGLGAAALIRRKRS